jgi:hypothetical protein
MEKRNRDRLSLDVFCRVAPSANRSQSAWKRIENISGTGLLVEWCKKEAEETAPKLGDTYTVELQLPSHPVFGQRVLQYKAIVVRVSRQSSGRVTAGLKTTKTSFKSLRPGALMENGGPSSTVQ